MGLRVAQDPPRGAVAAAGVRLNAGGQRGNLRDRGAPGQRCFTGADPLASDPESRAFIAHERTPAA